MTHQSVIVTGASSGLGAHITRRLVSDGARVVAASRRGDRLDRLAAELTGATGAVETIEADITRREDVDRMVDAAVGAFGGVDALVNNAGIDIPGRLEDLSEHDFDSMLRTNVIGPYLCMQVALPHLRERGGAIVNIGSTVVIRSPRHRFGYVASKGALESMSQALAGDLGPMGIRVNVVRPGIVPSELRGSSEAEEITSLQEMVPAIQALDAIGEGSDVAAAVAYLLSNEAKWITGAVLDVDGGYSLGVTR